MLHLKKCKPVLFLQIFHALFLRTLGAFSMMKGMTLKEDIMPGKQTNVLHASRLFQNFLINSCGLHHNYLMRRQKPIMWMYDTGDQSVAFLD